MSGETILSTLIGSAISVAATWFFAWLYYKRAGDDLRVRADRIQRTVNVLGQAMEAAGFAELVRDDHEDVTHMVLKGWGRIEVAPPRVQATGTVGPPPAPPE